MKKLIFLFLAILSSQAQAVEYICWQEQDYQGMAFETSSINCPGGNKEKGLPAQAPGGASKRIVCLSPASCLALTANVVKMLQTKTGLSSLEDIKKLDSKTLYTTFSNTPYISRPSTVICEGRGSSKLDESGKLGVSEPKCPHFTACANAEGVFYNMTTSPEMEKSQTHIEGTSPIKTIPTPAVRQ